MAIVGTNGRHRKGGGRNGTPGAAPVLNRIAFTTSRELEFFSLTELAMQIGHPSHLWAQALLKELIDNALDACEAAGMGPAVSVVIGADTISVRDNGPGLPREVLERSLNYAVRISDKAHYVSPTRGQLGNALKCVWAAPFALSGERGLVEVETRGQRHVIEVTLDRIAQKPCIQHETVRKAGVVKTGTLIRMHWPQGASLLDSLGGAGFCSAARLLYEYALFNPHAAFALDLDGRQLSFRPSDRAWEKWLPSWPTSCHWYTPERLCNLIAANVAAERDGKKAKTVREFVSEFHGLSGTLKQKVVVTAAGLAGAWLHDLVAGNDVDAEAVRRLLGAMTQAARTVRPEALGVVGQAHLAESLTSAWRCDKDSIRYKRVAGVEGGLPFVLELAFGVHQEDVQGQRYVAAGVNWSPAVGDSLFPELQELVGEMRVDAQDPVTLAAHLASPRLDPTDHGKGRRALPPAMKDALAKCVRQVASEWKREKRHADRDDRLHRQQLERLRKASQPKRLSLKEAAEAVMEQAYLQASGDKADPANARQIMYAARPRVLELTGGKCWKRSSYFTQTLLPRFVEAHPELTADWDVVFDARGRLIEPHTGKHIDLGTLQVRGYIDGWMSASGLDGIPSPVLSRAFPTAGPENRYNWALFVEKEGFAPLLERYRIADRYDIAIMSTKGMSVTAARRLVDRLSEKGVKILVLRDFDKSGFSIAHTLRTDSPRYRFNCQPNVIDIGLRLEDVRQWGLEALAEPVDYRKTNKDPRERLRIAGATEDECEFLVAERRGTGWSGRRVELNAFTSPRYIEFIEHKFAEVGVAKVGPTTETLKVAFPRAWTTARVQEAIDAELRAAAQDTAPALPRGLPAKIAKAIEGTDKPWDAALSEIVREMRAKK
jgi:DNA topoisomerase VI subunit B